ncbi:MAG: hypothetical protein ACAI43_15315 [Phycisphaerae bacterium]|nr:hypothetical protein [Tepidisphaeraceae bacterium]
MKALLAVIVVLGTVGCADPRTAWSGTWMEDVTPRLNQPDPDRAVVTVTPDGWVRTGRWRVGDSRVDPATVHEAPYEVRKHPSGQPFGVVGGLAFWVEGDHLIVQGPDRSETMVRTGQVFVPTTRPVDLGAGSK